MQGRREGETPAVGGYPSAEAPSVQPEHSRAAGSVCAPLGRAQGRHVCVVLNVLMGVSLSPGDLVIAYLCPFQKGVGEESKKKCPDWEGGVTRSLSV